MGGGISLPLSAAALAAMRYITTCEGKRLFSFRLEGNALSQLESVSETFVLTQLERGFHTLDFYKSLRPLPDR
jgi:DNA repair protein RecO (recombination protein O)